MLFRSHEFSIDLEDTTTPVHKLIYKLSPLELEVARKKIDHILEHEYFRPLDSPYGSPIPLALEKDRGL